MKQSTRDKGKHYETLARCYLEREGLIFLTSNYQTKFGEIDLIMKCDQELVFVEVRYRFENQCGNAIESITPHKQRCLQKTALAFLQQYPISDPPCRFDVCAIDEDHFSVRYQWIKNVLDR